MRTIPTLLLAFALLVTACSGSGPKPGSNLEAERLVALRNAVTGMRDMLEEYYEGSGVLEDSWYLTGDQPGHAEGISFLADKFARSVVWQDNFIIGTIGSSVTAGHGNCRYDCYQQQLERLMAPVLAVSGVGFEVRNSGQGGECGDSFGNQVWCLPMLVGDDVDITHYSWTYFEVSNREYVPAAHEMFYRWSLMMKHAPAPQIIYTNSCNRLRTGDEALLRQYAPFGADILCMTRGLAKLGYQRGKWGEMGNPLHTTSREGDLPGTSQARRESLAVMFRNWHPGPLLFQTTADTLAWRYSTALLLAIDRIESESHPRQRWPRKTGGLTLAELPSPMQCAEPWCTSPNPPSCINFEAPTFGVPGIALIENPDNGWRFDPGRPIRQRAVPKEEMKLPQCIHPNRCSGWVTPKGVRSGELTFDLPEIDTGFVAVCCSGKRCGQRLLDARAEFQFNGKPPVSEPEVLWKGKCVHMQFDLSGGSTRRHSHLTVKLPALEDPLPPITHVFGL